MFFGVRAALCKHTVSLFPSLLTHTEQAPIPNISMDYFPSPGPRAYTEPLLTHPGEQPAKSSAGIYAICPLGLEEMGGKVGVSSEILISSQEEQMEKLLFPLSQFSGSE